MLYQLLVWLSTHHKTPFLEMLAKHVGLGHDLEDVVETAKDYGIEDMVFLGSYRELLGDKETEDVTVFEWRNEEVKLHWFPTQGRAVVQWPELRRSWRISDKGIQLGAGPRLEINMEGIVVDAVIDHDYPERVNYRERELITWLGDRAGLDMLDEEMELLLFPPPRERDELEELEEVIENLEIEIERLKRVVRLWGEKGEMTLRDRTRSHGVIKRSRSRRAARKLRECERNTLDEEC